MRLLLDEHINPEVARQLRKKGHDVVSVEEAKMRGASDDLLLRFAARENRTVVTYNICDFQSLIEEWHRATRHHAGVIFVSERSIFQRRVGRLVRALIKVLEGGTEVGAQLEDRALFLIPARR